MAKQNPRLVEVSQQSARPHETTCQMVQGNNLRPQIRCNLDETNHGHARVVLGVGFLRVLGVRVFMAILGNLLASRTQWNRLLATLFLWGCEVKQVGVFLAYSPVRCY